MPMTHQVLDGQSVYVGYDGWDPGRFSLNLQTNTQFLDLPTIQFEQVQRCDY